ncbi:Pre-mRNA-splicing factor 38A [Intoshia linei]|uniref:Pre-mRNA-splicing factor 38 n=1 Tax=Intoshia linei TaxID=1819745 RepID=A0A177B8A4_9BILA|nr:Pre-mRNA-splicing factor 38A [Intoshia linei]
MSNRTVKDAVSIKSTNPQYLIEKIIRCRVYNSRYWKEDCFALTSELLVDKACELRYIGGIYSGITQPTDFLCLLLKLLQIQPEKEIIIEFLGDETFKYLRCLAAAYLRLTSNSIDCYKYLEPLYLDYRKVKIRNRDGTFKLNTIDRFVQELIDERGFHGITLPFIQKRHILEISNELEPRISPLEEDLDNLMAEDIETSESEPEKIEETVEKSNGHKTIEKRIRNRYRSESKNSSVEKHRKKHKHRRRSRSRSRSNRREKHKHKHRREKDKHERERKHKRRKSRSRSS